MTLPMPATRLRRGGLLVAVSTAVAGLTATWAVGQVARDATWATGLCFYIPSVVTAAALVVAAGLHAVTRRRRTALLALGLALAPVGFVGLVENDFGPKPSGLPSDVRVVHWNTGGRPDRPGIVEPLAAERADLYVLTEVPPDGSVEGLRAALDGSESYRSAWFGGSAVVGRGEVRANGWLVQRGRAKVQSVSSRHAGRTVELLVVDLPSELWVARDPLLREVNRLVEQYRPDLVIGDFNAPRRSWALSRLPAGYRHAYETSGSGWGYTWPVPVPMYALDHCLHGPRVAPGRYRLGGMGGTSDHTYQVFDFSLAAEGPGP
jgi:vancomycin resistance protein VanJ